MPLKEFDKNDIFKNVIKAKPYYNFKIYGNNINLNNLQDKYIKINSLNIPNISSYYSFIYKNANGQNLNNINNNQYASSLYGSILSSSYPHSSSIDISYYSSSVSSYSIDRKRIYALKNVLDKNIIYSQHFAYSSSLGNKEKQQLVLISVPSIFFGSSINPGSVELSYLYSGSTVGKLSDYKLNGELIQTTGSNSGSVAGVVLYNQGFILLTGSWDMQVSRNYLTSAYGSYLLSGGLNNVIYSIFSGSDGVYAGGAFTGLSGNYISRWNGTSWSPLAGGLGGIVYSIFSGSDGVYAGGGFVVTGNNIAKWNGTSWSPLAGGLNNPVLSIFSGSDGVYAGGSFAAGNYISRWNGTSWSPLAGGLQKDVRSIITASNGIYVGGNFSGVSGNLISRWDGTNWNPVGGGLSGSGGVVNSLFSGSDGIYAGGSFTVTGTNFAKWDGTNFISPVTVGYTVQTLCSGSEGVYLGGGGINLWNGSSLLTVQNAPGNWRWSIISSSNSLYIGGSFNFSGSTIVGYGNYNYLTSSLVLATWQNWAGGITNNYGNTYLQNSASFELNFKGINYIPTLTMMAHAKKDELNFSNNPTYLKYGQSNNYIFSGSNGFFEPDNIEIKNTKKYSYSNFTGSLEKQTFITKIGIYDDQKRLIAVAKLANPVKKTENRDFTFKLKLDI